MFVYTSEYGAYANMKTRVRNPNNKDYVNYGGRGIRICQRWLDSFKNFYQDMGEKPSPRHELDRIDNDGDYSPDNCRWATRAIQSKNKRVYKNNTTGHRGVYLDTRTKRPVAKIGVNGKLINIGTFNTIEEAIHARQEAEAQYFKPLLSFTK